MTKKTERIPNSAIAPFALRMQPDLKAALEESAQATGRSLNAEIVARLQISLDDERADSLAILALTETSVLHDETLSAHENWLEKIDMQISELREWTGRSDPNRGD